MTSIVLITDASGGISRALSQPLHTQGLKGLAAYLCPGMLAPPNMPQALPAKLHAELVRVMALPDVRDRALKSGNETVANSSDQFARKMRNEQEIWAV
jgi:tripartite-type tricarboxylate transporter receptor subunit TctC